MFYMATRTQNIISWRLFDSFILSKPFICFPTSFSAACTHTHVRCIDIDWNDSVAKDPLTPFWFAVKNFFRTENCTHDVAKKKLFNAFRMFQCDSHETKAERRRREQVLCGRQNRQHMFQNKTLSLLFFRRAKEKLDKIHVCFSCFVVIELGYSIGQSVESCCNMSKFV